MADKWFVIVLPTFFQFFFQTDYIIYHIFQYNFILVSPKIFKLCTYLGVFLFIWFGFGFAFWVFLGGGVSFCLPPSLTPDFWIVICPSLLLFLYNFVILLIKKSHFPFALSALNYWSVCKILDRTPKGRQCPFLKSQGPVGR